MKRFISLMLIAGMLLSVVACAEKTENSAETDAATEAATEEVTEYDPLAELDFSDRDFRVLTSSNDPGGVGCSNYLIEGPEAETGDIVEDAVWARNRTVEEKLGVKMVFEDVDLIYYDVSNYITTYIAAADDAYDVIIQDLFPCAALVLEGDFTNCIDGEYFDFTQDYWSLDCMEDLSVTNNGIYLLVGDYFIDVLRGSHALFFNKDLMTNAGINTADMYSTVNDGKWTYDEFLTIMKQGYADLNGDGNADVDDQFGYVAVQKWGPSIPFIVSGNPGFVEKSDDGTITFTVNNERSVKLADYLLEVFGDQSSLTRIGTNDLGEATAENIFRSGRSFFLGYQRLGSLEDFRDVEFDISLVPYPKLDETVENYTTSMHDTTEVGMVPITTSDTEFISAVLECLCRETNKSLIPTYYETALKVKYTRDDETAQMIDIVHNNLGNAFALAYDSSLNEILIKNTFYYGVIDADENNFVSTYEKKEKSALKKLDKMIEAAAALTEG